MNNGPPTNPTEFCEITIERCDDGRWSVWVQGHRVPSAVDTDLQVAVGRVTKALADQLARQAVTDDFVSAAAKGLSELVRERSKLPRTPISPWVLYTGRDAAIFQYEASIRRMREAENAGPHELLDGMIASGSLEQALADEVQGYGTLGPDERAWRDVNALTLKELRST